MDQASLLALLTALAGNGGGMSTNTVKWDPDN